MNLQKTRRKRGIVLTFEGWRRLQDAKLRSENQENFGNRYTIEELTERTGLDPGTVAKVLEREEGVDKRTLEYFFKAFDLELNENCYSNLTANKRLDWGEAIDVSVFYGRAEELATLEQWLLEDNCRLVALLGMGGIGKTCLSIKLAERIFSKFEYVIWRSLRYAPPVEAVLASLNQFLSDKQELETDLPEDVSGRVAQLIDYLRNHRCLLILDNVEAILCSGGLAGQYREGHEGYGELLKQVGQAAHQSCLVLTSQEKLKEVASLEGKTLPVRSLQLNGLKQIEGQEIFKMKGLCGSDLELRVLVERYAGNASALKIVATTIQDVFDGSISEFLKHSTVVFGDICELLNQQFERLSDLEKEIMYWLAINQEPVSVSQLCSDIVSLVPRPNLLEALESLRRRSLVERNAALFTLQPIFKDYITHRLINRLTK